MKKVSIAVLVVFMLSSCTDSTGARKTLIRWGYKDVVIGGYGWFSGSSSDFYKTKFKATAPNGETVTGVVTGGLFFKGNTIRLDN